MTNRGSLVIDNNIEIITSEDAHLGTYQVDTDTLLYAKPPAERGLIADLFGINPKITPLTPGVPFPAYFRDKENNYEVLVHQSLKKGSEVLARSIPNYAGVLEVATFEKIAEHNPSQPESGRGIKIISKGYVYTADLKKNSTDQFKKFSGDIFPHEDLMADIKQNTLGDCFLLSNLIGILSTADGAAYIRGMMRQEEDYTIVRLFDPTTNLPVYIKVDNTELCSNGRSAIEHGAPWVHIIEKAYAILAHKKNDPAIAKRNQNPEYALESYSTFPSFKEMYGNGGDCALAAKILTNNAAEEYMIADATSLPWDTDTLGMLQFMAMRTAVFMENTSAEEVANLELSLESVNRADKPALLKLINLLSGFILPDDSAPEIVAEKTTELNEFIKNNQNSPVTNLLQYVSGILNAKNQSPEKIFIKLNSLADYLNEYIKFILEDSNLQIVAALPKISLLYPLCKYVNERNRDGTWDKFVAAVKVDPHNSCYVSVARSFNTLRNLPSPLPALPPNVVRGIEQYTIPRLDPEKPTWNSQVGAGIYTPETLKIYDNILANKNTSVMTASTRTTFREGEGKGLCSRHAYGIVDAIQEGNLKYIVIRNPWGKFGLSHKIEDGTSHVIVDPKAALSYVELSYFVKNFRNYTIAKLPPVPKLERTASQESVSSEIEYKVSSPKISAWKMIGITTGASAVTGGAIGAGIGLAAALGAAIPTFGLSMLAIPLFAAVGTAIGAMTGFIGSTIGCLLANASEKNTQPKNIYSAIVEPSNELGNVALRKSVARKPTPKPPAPPANFEERPPLIQLNNTKGVVSKMGLFAPQPTRSKQWRSCLTFGLK